MYSAKILCDSISETGKRLTTFEITFPRCVLAEAETHRVIRGWDTNVDIDLHIHNLGINVDENLSRNSASSRAIPINKMLERVTTNPFIPEKFGKPASGMGAKEYYDLDSYNHLQLTRIWRRMLNDTVTNIRNFSSIGNKEDLNRLLEPFMWHTAIVTATEWDNFFKLRTNEAADWKIRTIADLMYDEYHFEEVPCADGSYRVEREAALLKVGEWHLPLISEEDLVAINSYIAKSDVVKEGTYGGWKEAQEYLVKKVSVARCARVSYLTHDGVRDIEEDLKLFEKLRVSGHWSPFEHVATPYFECVERDYLNQKNIYKDLPSGNFWGWKQFRKEFEDENCTHFRKEE